VKSLRVKVSVIMPAYNAEHTIAQAVQSVLKQKGVFFELLIGDDASTDGTLKQLAVYKTDPRVRIFCFKENRGTAITSNYLISKARGVYISSCDADDFLLPGNLKSLSEALTQRPSFGVAYGDSLIISKTGRKRINRRFIPEESWDLLGGCFAKGGTLIRRALLKKIGGYRPKFSYLEDCDLFVRLTEVTRFYYLRGKPLYCQNKLAGSLSDQSPKKIAAVSRMIVSDAIERRYGIKFRG